VRQEFSKSVRLAAWNRCGGSCEQCTAKLYPGRYEFHHIKEATFGGESDLGNCRVLCVSCHSGVTGSRAAVVAKSNRQRNKHLGIKKKRSQWAYGKGSKFKKKINGEVVKR
jgi:5-methylcytosine-specific restriction protein A